MAHNTPLHLFLVDLMNQKGCESPPEILLDNAYGKGTDRDAMMTASSHSNSSRWESCCHKDNAVDSLLRPPSRGKEELATRCHPLDEGLQGTNTRKSTAMKPPKRTYSSDEISIVQDDMARRLRLEVGHYPANSEGGSSPTRKGCLVPSMPANTPQDVQTILDHAMAEIRMVSSACSLEV